MALVKCADCGTQVSTSAKACPNCGAPRKKPTSAVTWFVGGLFAFVVAGMVFKKDPPPSPPVSTKVPPAGTPTASKEPSQADLQIQAGIAAARAIKAATKNPASFQLESFLIYPGGATCIEYRGTNSFNAVVPGRGVFVPATPTLLTQDRDGNKFVKVWNDVCTKSGGQERARGIKALGAI